MLHCFQAVRHKLECKSGFFDLYGCDFLVDDEFKVRAIQYFILLKRIDFTII